MSPLAKSVVRVGIKSIQGAWRRVRPSGVPTWRQELAAGAAWFAKADNRMANVRFFEAT